MLIIRISKKRLNLYLSENRKNNRFLKKLKKVKRDTPKENKIKSLQRKLFRKNNKTYKILNKLFPKFIPSKKFNNQRKKFPKTDNRNSFNKMKMSPKNLSK